MIKYFNSKEKLIKKMNLNETIVFGYGDISLNMMIFDFLDTICEKANKNNFNTVADVVEYQLSIYIDKNIKIDNILRGKIIDAHTSLILSHELDNWNNELFYHDRIQMASQDLVAHIKDKFIEKFSFFARMNILDIKRYLNKEIKLNEISIYEKEVVSCKSKLRLKQMSNYLDFSEFFTDKKYTINEDYYDYDFSLSFEENLINATDNYNEIKKDLINAKIELKLNINEREYSKVNIGSYIDFKSLNENSFYLMIEGLESKYSVQIYRMLDDYLLMIYDHENQKDAKEELYRLVFNKIKCS